MRRSSGTEVSKRALTSINKPPHSVIYQIRERQPSKSDPRSDLVSPDSSHPACAENQRQMMSERMSDRWSVDCELFSTLGIVTSVLRSTYKSVSETSGKFQESEETKVEIT